MEAIMKVLNDTNVNRSNLSLSIFGLGYVGAVSSACFASIGVEVIGVDPDEKKVNLIKEGKSPIVEKGLPELLKKGVNSGKLLVTTNPKNAVLNSNISFVCVGTPSAENGSCDLKYLKIVSKQIGEVLAKKNDYHVVVFRSTVPPGSTSKVMKNIIEEASGKKAGKDFGLAFHPEFLRESTAIEDFHAPPKTVIGGIDEKSSYYVGQLYQDIDDKIIYTTIEAAEMVKYVDNTWHALKVSFANEIGKICKANEIDSHKVMDIFVQDTKLNLSPYYLKPGFAWGGSCLPKDVRGINHLAQEAGVEVPILDSIINSNESQIDYAVRLIEETGNKKIGFLGITFKADTDDMRESPVIHVIEKLMAKGYEISVFDSNIDLETSVRHHLMHSKHEGKKENDLMSELPNMLKKNVGEVMKDSETIVITHATELFRQAALSKETHHKIVELVRLFNRRAGDKNVLHKDEKNNQKKKHQQDRRRVSVDLENASEYVGICW
jgi:GDP-mannose 6-dehydrogenase